MIAVLPDGPIDYFAFRNVLLSGLRLFLVVLLAGVRVNAVAPGPVWTPLIPSTMPAEKVKTFGADTAFGRAAQPVEIAPLFVFLASGEARFVTGEVYGATGGQTPF